MAKPNPDYQDNTNSGAIFMAREKRNERSPDRTGECEIKCPHCDQNSTHWISGWIKEARATGKKFLSIAFTPKDDQPGGASAAKDNKVPDFDDDIPF